MENQEQFEDLENQLHPQLIVTEDMRSYFYDMAKWANFLGIVGIVISSFLFLGALTVGPTINANPEMGKMLGQLGAMGGTTIAIVFFIYGMLIFSPSLLLLRYAAKAKQGVLYGEQASLNEATSRLKSLFKYFGVLVIVFIAFYLITLFSVVFGGIK